MTDKEKIQEIRTIIKDTDIMDVIITVDDAYREMACATMYDIADLLADMSNAINNIRDLVQEES